MFSIESARRDERVNDLTLFTVMAKSNIGAPAKIFLLYVNRDRRALTVILCLF